MSAEVAAAADIVVLVVTADLTGLGTPTGVGRSSGGQGAGREVKYGWSMA